MGIVQFVLKTLINSKLSFIPLLLILIIGGLQFIFSLNPEWLVSTFGLSRNSLWGILTDFFVHADFLHYSNNMLILFIFTISYVFMNGYLPDALQKRRSLFFTLSAFICGIITNIFFIIIAVFLLNAQGYTYGASGLVYAVQGIALTIALCNLVQVGNRWFALIRIKKTDPNVPNDYNKQYFSTSVFIFLNFIVAAFFIYFTMTNPQSFVNVAQNVNFLGHAIGFIAGMFSGVIFYFIKKEDFEAM